ncbi:uncharacterized protein TOL2_C38410 [Desulfobacula toluolica Tol2]|uniref:Thioesterase domain-containing protein n=2 Tax=Desulfobacula TaxID=28222 RepID=K0NSM2_DESTT|nr:uncharacterized protein TOL2_C38410 [Desulfobacula toluolica Tol2]
MIKTMTLMYELYKKKEVTLSQITQAKFIEPVFADTVTCFIVKANRDKLNRDKQTIKLQGKVLKSEKIIAKISLILQE